MARLQVIVEGQTEQAFAANVLAPYLAAKGVYLARPQLAAHARRHGRTHRGGLFSYAPFKNDCVRRLKEDQSRSVFLSTMIDLYALPNDFPGTDACKGDSDPCRRVQGMEKALAEDINDPRFLPYIQLHEFEAVLLADPSKFATYYDGCTREIEQLQLLAATVASPELIDDGQQTAPAKRIAALIPAYADEKPIAGPIIAAAIGPETIRKRCPHFNAWLTRLENLGTTDP
jgi:hypothetical protein